MLSLKRSWRWTLKLHLNPFPYAPAHYLTTVSGHAQFHEPGEESRLESLCKNFPRHQALRPGSALGSPSAEQLLFVHIVQMDGDSGCSELENWRFITFSYCYTSDCLQRLTPWRLCLEGGTGGGGGGGGEPSGIRALQKEVRSWRQVLPPWKWSIWIPSPSLSSVVSSATRWAELLHHALLAQVMRLKQHRVKPLKPGATIHITLKVPHNKQEMAVHSCHLSAGRGTPEEPRG